MGLADYYRALPAFSTALDGAFLRSPMLVEAIHRIPHQLIKIAVQLRNEVLYRECLIQCMGPYGLPKYVMIQNASLRKIGEDAYCLLGRMVLDTQYKLLNNMGVLLRQTPNDQRAINFQTLERQLAAHCTGFVPGAGAPIGIPGMLMLPWFYRELYAAANGTVPAGFKAVIQPLMRNNLALDPKAERAGEGKYGDHFLCLEIEDEDLPWNTEETDW